MKNDIDFYNYKILFLICIFIVNRGFLNIKISNQTNPDD